MPSQSRTTLIMASPPVSTRWTPPRCRTGWSAWRPVIAMSTGELPARSCSASLLAVGRSRALAREPRPEAPTTCVGWVSGPGAPARGTPRRSFPMITLPLLFGQQQRKAPRRQSLLYAALLVITRRGQRISGCPPTPRRSSQSAMCCATSR